MGHLPANAVCWCGHTVARHGSNGCRAHQRFSPWHSEPCVCHDTPEQIEARAARRRG